MQFKNEKEFADYLGFEDVILRLNRAICAKRFEASNYYFLGNFYVDMDLNKEDILSHSIIFQGLEYSFVNKNGIFYLELI